MFLEIYPNGLEKKLASLMVLRLHKNNFIGRIPQSLCKTSNLQILDVAYYYLTTGPIPRCLGELNAMDKIYVAVMVTIAKMKRGREAV